MVLFYFLSKCKFCLQSIHFLTKISENVGINNITDSSSRNHTKFVWIIKDILFCHPIQAGFELELCIIMLTGQTKDSPLQGS